MSNKVLIQTEHLCKKFGSVTAVHDLSFQLCQGEFLGLLGPNGAGKTTTINIIQGLITPTSGRVSVMGFNPDKHKGRIAERSNFASAYVTLPANLKVIENLTIFSRLYGVKNRKEKIRSLLEAFEIAHLEKRLTGALSSGERTRLNLAKCFLNDPELLILDEPTASLDPDMADKVQQTLKRMQKDNGLGVLYTSHNMSEVEKLCHRVIFIHHGKQMAQGTPAEIHQKFETNSLNDVFIKIVRQKPSGVTE